MKQQTAGPAWERKQKRTFTAWVNRTLASGESGLQVSNLMTDLGDGLVLLEVLKVIAPDIRIGKYNKKPKMDPHKLDNLSVVFRVLEEAGVALAFVKPRNILEGNKTMILGLIWTLILEFEIKTGLREVEEQLSVTCTQEEWGAYSSTIRRGVSPVASQLSAKDTFLKWVQLKVKGYGLQPRNFTSAFCDGKVFLALVHCMRPDLFAWASVRDSPKQNLELAFKLAEAKMNIPRLLDSADLLDQKPDAKSVMTYCIEFLKYEQKNADFIKLLSEKYGTMQLEDPQEAARKQQALQAQEQQRQQQLLAQQQAQEEAARAQALAQQQMQQQQLEEAKKQQEAARLQAEAAALERQRLQQEQERMAEEARRASEAARRAEEEARRLQEQQKQLQEQQRQMEQQRQAYEAQKAAMEQQARAAEEERQRQQYAEWQRQQQALQQQQMQQQQLMQRQQQEAAMRAQQEAQRQRQLQVLEQQRNALAQQQALVMQQRMIAQQQMQQQAMLQQQRQMAMMMQQPMMGMPGGQQGRPMQIKITSNKASGSGKTKAAPKQAPVKRVRKPVAPVQAKTVPALYASCKKCKAKTAYKAGQKSIKCKGCGKTVKIKRCCSDPKGN